MATAWIWEHPGDFRALLPRKLYRFFSPVERTTGETLNGSLLIAINLVYFCVLLLAAWGMWKLVQAHPLETWLVLILPVFYATFIALVFYGGARYALPIVPAISIGGANGLLVLAASLAERFGLHPHPAQPAN
jgi:hypothetical protein